MRTNKLFEVQIWEYKQTGQYLEFQNIRNFKAEVFKKCARM